MRPLSAPEAAHPEPHPAPLAFSLDGQINKLSYLVELLEGEGDAAGAARHRQRLCQLQQERRRKPFHRTRARKGRSRCPTRKTRWV